MKRSKTMSLALMGMCPFVITACGEQKQEALIYPSVQVCIEDGKLDAAQCQAEFENAAKEHERTAPRYASENDCNNEYGASQCYRPSGSNYFLPLLAGYMIARATSPSNYYGGSMGRAHPVYRSRYEPSTWRTPDGYRIGSGQGKVMVPESATRPKVSASSMFRGGFGSQASARSSWGS